MIHTLPKNLIFKKFQKINSQTSLHIFQADLEASLLLNQHAVEKQ